MTAKEEPIWSFKVSVDEVPEAGAHFDLAADERVRGLLATAMGLRSLPRLSASFDVQRQGRRGLRVTGEVAALIGQYCVVSLEPMETELLENIDLAFVPPAEPTLANADGEATIDFANEDPPETLSGSSVDLGAVTTEYLLLGIDPYPRRPDAVFEPKVVGDPVAHPFAALEALKKPKGEK